jgi:hypothetical protein
VKRQLNQRITVAVKGQSKHSTKYISDPGCLRVFLQISAMAGILLTTQAATRTLSPANWHRSRARSTTAVQEVFQRAGLKPHFCVTDKCCTVNCGA